MIEKIIHKNIIIAIIIRNDYKKDGIEFFTPNNFSQQLGYMSHKKGKIIEPHLHKEVQRKVALTQEVLILKKGKLRVDFYDNDRRFLEYKLLLAGGIILLASGGHGFEVLEDIEMIEVKQGPYYGDMDKIRFTPSKEN